MQNLPYSRYYTTPNYYDWYPRNPAYGGARAPSLNGNLDWEIRRDIRDHLFWSPFVDAEDITVKVEDGVATLTGEVNSWLEFGSAQDNAYQAGAASVVNKLEVVESS